MTEKTDFKKLEATIKEAESLPKVKGNSDKEFLDIESKYNELRRNAMNLIWHWGHLIDRKNWYHLNDSTSLGYEDRIEILLDALYTSRDGFLRIYPTLGTPTIRTNSNQKCLISITSTPDDFYNKLINEINILYDNDRYIPVCLLLRKLFENLIIDILRKKYSSTQANLFYNTSKGMFQSFSVLLDNLKAKIDDFKPIDPNFNNEIIKRIDFYRERGNSSAHSISVEITLKDIDDKKAEINYLVKLLMRVLNNI